MKFRPITPLPRHPDTFVGVSGRLFLPPFPDVRPAIYHPHPTFLPSHLREYPTFIGIDSQLTPELQRPYIFHPLNPLFLLFFPSFSLVVSFSSPDYPVIGYLDVVKPRLNY